MTSKERKDNFIKAYAQLFHLDERKVAEEVKFSGITRFFENQSLLNEEQKTKSQAILELTKLIPLMDLDERITISSCEDAARLVHDMNISNHKESTIVIYLDAKHQVIERTVSTIGNQSSTVVNVQDIYKKALEVNACSFIFAHNHPSGDITPSNPDIQVTRKLIEAGKLLDIPLIDHVIIDGRNPSHSYSFRRDSQINFEDNFAIGLNESNNDYQEMKDYINQSLEKNVKAFVMALMSVETDVNDKEVLETVYNYYMESDHLTGVLNEELYEKVLEKAREIEINEDYPLSVKEALINWFNQNYAESYDIALFDEHFPNKKEIGLAFSTTPNGEISIQTNLNLEDLKIETLIDGQVVTQTDLRHGSPKESLERLEELIHSWDFDELIYVDDRDLENIGLITDDHGNFVPLLKDRELEL